MPRNMKNEELYDEEAGEEIVSSPTGSSKSRMKRLLMLTGTLALAGGAFAAGYFSSTNSGGAAGSSLVEALSSHGGVSSPLYQNRKRLRRAIVYLVQTDDALMANPALSDPAALTQAVAVYKLTGHALFELPTNFLDLMAQVAPEVPQWLVDAIFAPPPADGGARRLSEEAKTTQLFKVSRPKLDLSAYGNLVETLKAERNLGAAESLDFINRLYIFVATDVRNMAHTVDYKHENLAAVGIEANDHFGIQLEGEDCYIAARETDEDGDWVNNGLEGIIDIESIEKQRYGLTGIAAFVDVYNKMRLDLWNIIQTECQAKGATKYNFGGWSRGGALAAVAAAALNSEGLLKKDEVRLMTFGAPRALEVKDAKKVHGRFEAWRLVYKDDFVTSLGPAWTDVAHYGTLVSKGGSFPLGRDEPFFVYAEPTWADHAGYFMDWLPSAAWDESQDHQRV